MCPLYNNVGHHRLCFPAGRRWLCISAGLCIHWREKEHSLLIQRIIQDYLKAYVSSLSQFGGSLLNQIILALKLNILVLIF